MNIKDNKGITLITLIVTVIVLAILAYVSVSIGVNWTNTAKFENIETYMLLIQSKCETMLNEVAIGNIEEEELYGVKQESGNLVGWYRLEQMDLNDIGVKDAKEKDRILCRL